MSALANIARPGYSLAAVESGHGPEAPVILFSNSLAAATGMWQEQRALFADRYRIIGYDTRGHGRSETPPGPYSFDDLVADALAVMDHFEVSRAHFVGLSLGGMTGLGVALAAPERLEKLVCCAARADAPPAFVSGWDDRVAAVRDGGMEAVWPGTRDRWLTDAFRTANPDAVAALEADFLSTAVEGYAGCAAALKGLDYLPRLSGMTVPALYICGAEDVAAPPQAMEEMAAATPAARYERIPDAAHIINVNAADAFNRLLTEFLME